LFVGRVDEAPPGAEEVAGSVCAELPVAALAAAVAATAAAATVAESGAGTVAQPKLSADSAAGMASALEKRKPWIADIA
jgi:hypothetical protein